MLSPCGAASSSRSGVCEPDRARFGSTQGGLCGFSVDCQLVLSRSQSLRRRRRPSRYTALPVSPASASAPKATRKSFWIEPVLRFGAVATGGGGTRGCWTAASALGSGSAFATGNEASGAGLGGAAAGSDAAAPEACGQREARGVAAAGASAGAAAAVLVAAAGAGFGQTDGAAAGMSS